MARSPLALLAVFALASTALLGCGGGGGGGGGNNGGSGKGIVTNFTGQKLTGATVTFYGRFNNTPLATLAVGTDGRIPVPPAGATRFAVRATGLFQEVPTVGGTVQYPYYDLFYYNDGVFDGTAGCYASLPNEGSNTGFDSNIVFASTASPPPPPANGCVGIG